MNARGISTWYADTLSSVLNDSTSSHSVILSKLYMYSLPKKFGLKTKVQIKCFYSAAFLFTELSKLFPVTIND